MKSKLPRLVYTAALFASACALLSCGSGTASAYLVDTPTSGSGSGTGTAFVLYHSYGDSITHGETLSSPATEAYPAIVAAGAGLPLQNRANSGDQACDVPRRQIFQNAEKPTLTEHGLYSLMISTNDADIKGTGAYEAVFNLCHQAAIAWLALPEEYKVRTTAAAVTSSGTVSVETQGNWNALTTGGQGASFRVPFNRAAAGPAYVWYRIQDGSAGTFTYTLDSSPPVALSSATLPAMHTANGSTDSLALLRLPAVAAGDHALIFQQTSNGTAGVGVVAIGVPPATALAGMPLLLVGTTPRQLLGGKSPCDLNDSICQAYIADITANVSLLAGDGLNVKLVDVRNYLGGLTTEMSDALHPNATGQAELAHSFADVLTPLLAGKARPAPVAK